MNIDSAGLLDIISNPLFISIASALVGVLAGGLITWVLFLKQINWEVMTKHHNDLKDDVIVPWLIGLEEMPQMPLIAKESVRAADRQLFDDLVKEHYPELDYMWKDYTETQEKQGKEERAFVDEISKNVEVLLEKAKIKFQREYKPMSDVCFSGYVATYVHGVLESNRWYASLLIEPNSSADLFLVKIDGTEVFRTSNEAEANKIRDELEKIVNILVVKSDLNEGVRCIRELRKTTLEKWNKLTETLRDLRRKSRLKLRKKLGIFPRPCKYLKP